MPRREIIRFFPNKTGLLPLFNDTAEATVFLSSALRPRFLFSRQYRHH